MKAQSKEEKKTNRETKFNSFCCTSGLLLSVVCCIALIRVELKIQCGQMEKEILQKVQQNYERWQINKGRNSDGAWHETQGKVNNSYELLKRSIYTFEKEYLYICVFKVIMRTSQDRSVRHQLIPCKSQSKRPLM